MYFEESVNILMLLTENAQICLYFRLRRNVLTKLQYKISLF